MARAEDWCSAESAIGKATTGIAGQIVALVVDGANAVGSREAELLATMLWAMLITPLEYLPPEALMRAPPLEPPELLAKVLLVMVTLPPPLTRPPPMLAELLAKVLLVMVTFPLPLARPPPPLV